MDFDLFSVFITIPWLAAIPAAVFYWLYHRFRLKIVLAAALLWAAYLLYELAIFSGLLCEEDCNIRVDLLIVYPLLAVMSFFAIIRILMKRKQVS